MQAALRSDQCLLTMRSSTAGQGDTGREVLVMLRSRGAVSFQPDQAGPSETGVAQQVLVSAARPGRSVGTADARPPHLGHQPVQAVPSELVLQLWTTPGLSARPRSAVGTDDAGVALVGPEGMHQHAARQLRSLSGEPASYLA